MAATPDVRRAISASDDGTLKLWGLRDRRPDHNVFRASPFSCADALCFRGYFLEGARCADAGLDMARATVTAKRLAAALALQPPPATPPIAIRDRAILLLTFASRRRRPEIAGLNIRGPRFQSQRVCDPHDPHEPDQAGAGQFVPVSRIETGRVPWRRSTPVDRSNHGRDGAPRSEVAALLYAPRVAP
jgi:hypothetical protein